MLQPLSKAVAKRDRAPARRLRLACVISLSTGRNRPCDRPVRWVAGADMARVVQKPGDFAKDRCDAPLSPAKFLEYFVGGMQRSPWVARTFVLDATLPPGEVATMAKVCRSTDADQAANLARVLYPLPHVGYASRSAQEKGDPLGRLRGGREVRPLRPPPRRRLSAYSVASPAAGAASSCANCAAASSSASWSAIARRSVSSMSSLALRAWW